jgi:hypothetical protein
VVLFQCYNLSRNWCIFGLPIYNNSIAVQNKQCPSVFSNLLYRDFICFHGIDKLDKKGKNYKGRGGIRVKKKNFKTLKLFYSSVFISFKTKWFLTEIYDTKIQLVAWPEGLGSSASSMPPAWSSVSPRKTF